MIELTFLVLLHRLMDWGCAPVIASRAIAADALTLRSIVSEPAHQARVVAGLGARLRPAGDGGSRSTARVVPLLVRLGGRDLLWITWILTPGRGTTEVDLVAQADSRGLLARLVMLLGGRRWLRHRLEAALGTLAAVAHDVVEDLDNGAASVAALTAVTGRARRGSRAARGASRGTSAREHRRRRRRSGVVRERRVRPPRP